jgi:uncharacterized protein (DUF488 family)
LKEKRDVFFTVGYQGHDVTSILRLLKENKIGLIVDVRQNPVSRKTGFSGSRLQVELERNGINYAHYPCLGTPPSIRLQYQKNGNALTALKAYATYLRSKNTCLKGLVEFAGSKRFCLLCLERDHNLCHRGVIANKIAEMTQCRAIHLT